MAHRSPHRVPLSQEASHGLRLGRRFHDNQFPLATASRLGWGKSLVRGSPSHAIELRPTNRARTNRYRGSFGIKGCFRVLYFSFGFTLHAIGFHANLLSVYWVRSLLVF